MTLTTACIESWPVTVFWTWMTLTIGIIIGAWWAGGRGERDDDASLDSQMFTHKTTITYVYPDKQSDETGSARQRGEGVE